MDALDRKILTELQLDGRLTVTELAARVKLSVSPATAAYATSNARARSAATAPSWTRRPSA